MSPRDTFDVAIVGGGIVGTATAMQLSKFARVLLLESEDRLAPHQTGNNSGVIHSGLYYRPGSLKADNCTEGRNALYAFCKERNIPHEQCGKIVVATCPEQIPALEELERRGKANGLAGLKRLAPEDIRELEPHAQGIDGLHVPQTGIVDFTAVTKAYGEVASNNGATISLGSKVRKIDNVNGDISLHTKTRIYRSKQLINCAGLQCDRVAKMSGVQPKMRIIPFRGEYYQLKPKNPFTVRNLIYPVPDPGFPFLGVHFTRRIDGTLEAGPNAVLALKREGYQKGSFSLKDTGSILFYRGFWKLVSKYGKTGLGEEWRSANKAAFTKALAALVPQVRKNDLQRGGSGVRAQAISPEGKLLDDFLIKQSQGMIHVLNAPSPAATASLAIAQKITALALANG